MPRRLVDRSIKPELFSYLFVLLYLSWGTLVIRLYAAVRGSIKLQSNLHGAGRGNDYNIIVYLVVRKAFAICTLFEQSFPRILFLWRSLTSPPIWRAASTRARRGVAEARRSGCSWRRTLIPSGHGFHIEGITHRVFFGNLFKVSTFWHWYRRHYTNTTFFNLSKNLGNLASLASLTSINRRATSCAR